MAGETSRRQWWLVLRRDGYRTIKVKLIVSWVPDGSDLDSIVDPLELNQQDWEFHDDTDALPSADPDLTVRHELVAVTAGFESSYVEIG